MKKICQGYRLFPRVTVVCLLVLFGIDLAKASALTVHLSGSVTLNTGARQDFNDFGLYRVTDPSGDPAGASGASFLAAGTPAPILVAAAGSAPHRYSRSVGRLIYDLEVLGPDGEVPVIVDVFGRAFSNGGEGASFVLQATWSLEGNGTLIGGGIETGLIHSAFSDEFSRLESVMLTANRIYRVTMFANAEAAGGEFGASSLALVDPVFSFGPGVDPAYSFHFADGIGNSSIPEPGSMVLLSTGAIAVFVIRGRSKLRRGAVPVVRI